MGQTPTTRETVGTSPSAETYVLFWIAFQEGEVHYGVCLNRYMVATAPSQSELEVAIVAMVDAHMEASGELGVVPFAHLPQAPAEYWTRWLEVTSRAPLRTLVPSRGAHWPPLQLAAEPLGVLSSLQPPEGADIEAAWRQEVAARVAAVDAGEVEAIPWNKVRDRLVARLGAPPTGHASEADLH